MLGTRGKGQGFAYLGTFQRVCLPDISPRVDTQQTCDIELSSSHSSGVVFIEITTLGIDRFTDMVITPRKYNILVDFG